jgi:hypothetical protein
MLGTMNVLADAGLSNGTISEGGKVWQNPTSLGTVFSTALALRRRFAIGSACISLPLLIFLLRENGATWAQSLSLSASTALLFLISIQNVILQAIPKLHQEVASLQKIEIKNSFARALGTAAMIIAIPHSTVALVAAIPGQLWANARLKKLSEKHIETEAPEDEEIRHSLLNLVRRAFPGAVYYCFSGQITIWLLSVFGSQTGIAQAGALGRIAQVLTVASAILGIVVLPRFARLPPNRRILQTRYAQALSIGFLLTAIYVLLTWIFSTPILAILGASYRELNVELVLQALVSGTGLLAGLVQTLNSSRGWVMKPAFVILPSLLVQIFFIAFGTISNLRGALSLSITVNCLLLVSCAVYATLQLNKQRIDCNL